MTERNNNDDLFIKEMKKLGVIKETNHCKTDQSIHNLPKYSLASLPKATYAKRRVNAQKTIAQSNTSCLSEFSVEGIDAFENIEHHLFTLTNKKKRKLHFLEGSNNFTIDLHGYTIDQARDELCCFIKEASNNNIKYVQIIHGTSTSSTNNKNTLKSFCVHWLKQIPEVVAFCSARRLRNKIAIINFGAINALLK
jgi:DNA-nicking Smr family endonuclease